MSTAEDRAAQARLITAEGVCYHGVEFPSGRVVLDSEERLVCAATSIDHLLDAPDMRGATIERPEETT